jgi:transposase
LEWWDAYHKAHPQENTGECLQCGAPLTGKHTQDKYCSRECYLRAMAGKNVEVICAWCGEEFTAKASAGRIYCSQACAVAGRNAPSRRTGRRKLPITEAEEWHSQLTAAVKAEPIVKKESVARLVCGIMNMNNGIDGLTSVIRYGLVQDPYDGNIYAFRDWRGGTLKYIQWDGTAFILSVRKAQSGLYPWPTGKQGVVVDISMEEWHYLLSQSIIPSKLKTPKKRRKKKYKTKTKKAKKLTSENVENP